MDYEGYRPQGTHLGLLADLIQSDGIRQQDLAIATIKDKATITRALQSLEKNGFVSRKIDPTDRRQKLIFLTDKGRCLWSYATNFTQQAVERSLEGIEPAARRNCVSVLRKMYLTLNRELNQDLSPPPQITKHE